MKLREPQHHRAYENCQPPVPLNLSRIPQRFPQRKRKLSATSSQPAPF